MKLEEELRIEEEKNHYKMIQEVRNREYFRMQKERIYEYQKIKAIRMQDDNHQKQEDMQTDLIRDHQRKVRNEANVSSLFLTNPYRKSVSKCTMK